MELYSLLHFIKLEFWGDHSWWNNQIMKPLKRGEKNVYETIRIILKPIMLRRTKDSKDIQGNNIIKLP
jgi:DNA repair protein RAD5